MKPETQDQSPDKKGNIFNLNQISTLSAMSQGKVTGLQ
jgi:hypothetical protein